MMAPKAGGWRNGFTLVEVLVASTVLVLLVVLTAQMISSTTSMVTLGDRRMDTDSQARLVLSRMAADIAGMLRRGDADYFFVKNTGNDALYFYSQTTGYHPGGEGSANPLTFVGYRIANRQTPTAVAPNGVLERVGIGMGYDNLQVGEVARFLSYPAPTVALPSPPPLPESTLAWAYGANGAPVTGNLIGVPPTWDNPPYATSNQAPLSSLVFRLEFCFLMSDGTYFAPVPPGSTPWNNTDFIISINKIRKNAVGLNVTVALLDEKSQRLMAKDGFGLPDFSKAIAALVDGDQPDVAAKWNTVLEASIAANSSMSTLGMPNAAASQIRIYQRAFRFVK